MRHRVRRRRNPEISLTTMLAVGAAAVGGYFLIVKPMLDKLASVAAQKAKQLPVSTRSGTPYRAMQPTDMV
jgi:hypothetical protein